MLERVVQCEWSKISIEQSRGMLVVALSLRFIPIATARSLTANLLIADHSPVIVIPVAPSNRSRRFNDMRDHRLRLD